ncbi:MAG: restriction endonuclease [Kofleriaceae bacterium]|nr:restriction endonuclease [Kofleriaceae bacterium]
MAKVKKSTTTAEKKAPKKPVASTAKPVAKPGSSKAAAAKPATAVKAGAKASATIKPASAGKAAKAGPAHRDAGPEVADHGAAVFVAEPAPVVVAPVLTEEERALSEVYGDDLSPAGGAHAEFRDQRTADEDRPMMPEINARQERKKMWDDRRDHRGRRREERDRERQARRDARQANTAGAGASGAAHVGAVAAPGGNGPQAPRHASPPRHEPRRDGRDNRDGRDKRDARPAAGAAPRVTAAPLVGGTSDAAIVALGAPGAGRIGNAAGDAAAALFATLPHAQPIPVKQLAQMLRKRGMFEADPETYWPTLKAELLHDERSYRAVGLRPRVSYRGRDLFSPGPALIGGSAAVERTLAAAIGQLHDYAFTTLAARIRSATASGFERLITAYLVATGYTDIGWVKRVDGISYASATAPGIGKQVLISARSGSEPVDRRGVGELRVGVEAKGLLAGVLFSAAPLSPDAERELERGGRSITVVCADSLTRALIDAGVGVAMAPAQLRYLDDGVLDELLSGVA